MNTKDFAAGMIEDSGYQLNTVLKGVSDEMSVAAPFEGMMSIRAQVVHVAEAYLAIEAGSKGEKYEWGSYGDPGGSFESVVATVNGLRENAVSIALEHLEEHPEYARDYLAAHDYYHVGQLVSLRSALDKEFNPFSIYRH